MVKTESDQPNTRPDPFECEHLRKLFIGGLDHRTTDDKLKTHFGQWGEVVDSVVMKDPHTKRSRGFGFITYSQPEMIDAAQAARPHKLDGKVVEPKRAVPRNQINTPEASATVKKILVEGIEEDITEEDLSNYFGTYGNIIAVSLVTDKDTGKRTGSSFIEFDDYDSVDRICLAGSHSLKGKPIDVKKALSKADLNKIQATKNANQERAQRQANSSNRNNQNNANARSDTWSNSGTPSGAPMTNNMMPVGYPPNSNWMANTWQNGAVMGPNMGMVPNMANNAMNPAMYSAGMASNCMNMNPMAGGMNMAAYGQPPNMGMANMAMMSNMNMADPNMYNSSMVNMNMSNMNASNMAQAMGSNSRMTSMPNNGTINWNYGTAVPATTWPTSNDTFNATYQQAYNGGPVKSTTVIGAAVRSTPYTTGATSATTTINYPVNYTNGQTTTSAATSTATTTRRF